MKTKTIKPNFIRTNYGIYKIEQITPTGYLCRNDLFIKKSDVIKTDTELLNLIDNISGRYGAIRTPAGLKNVIIKKGDAWCAL